MFKQNRMLRLASVLVVVLLSVGQLAYGALTDSCNVCHRNHGYGFILIARPSVPALTNQRYEP